MDLKSLLPLLQTGLKMYAGGQLAKKSGQAKDVAVRSSVIAFGSLTLLLFLLASIIMVFVDLGHQFEAGRDLYFSGMMLSALSLTGLGALVLGLCLVASKILSSREKEREEAAKAEENPYAPLILLGEEFLKQLIHNLNQPKTGGSTAPSTPPDPR